ncbi:MAG: hypothetical protein IIB05_10200 [Bacteroidetes bacterium]|nr:hypothetical protein [Bacteroidota bacterium]
MGKIESFSVSAPRTRKVTPDAPFTWSCQSDISKPADDQPGFSSLETFF